MNGLYKPKIFWVGAGRAQRPLELPPDCSNVIFVEPLEVLFSQLEKEYPNSTIIKGALTDGDTDSFDILNIIEYSSLDPMLDLKGLYPGITKKKSISVALIRNSELFSDLASEDNVLVLDFFDPSCTTLKYLIESTKIFSFSSIYVLSISEKYIPISEVFNSDFESLGKLNFLESERIFVEDGIEYRVFINPKSSGKIQSLTSYSSPQIQENVYRLVSSLKQDLVKELDATRTSLLRQIESFSSIQAFLNNGSVPIDFHGWPVSPDICVYIIQILMVRDFHVSLEFGSGTSTVLFSKIIEKKCEISPDKFYKHYSFEHNEVYKISTDSLIKAAGTSDNTEVVLAELKDFEINGSDYRYYNCEKKLSQIVDKLKSSQDPSIFVLVDGPPGSTNPKARFPALPILLKYFSHCTLYILMDDYNREDEKEIVNDWIRELKSRSIKYKKIEKNFEKGACLIIVNGSK